MKVMATTTVSPFEFPFSAHIWHLNYELLWCQQLEGFTKGVRQGGLSPLSAKLSSLQ